MPISCLDLVSTLKRANNGNMDGLLKSAIVAMCALRAAKARRVAKICFTPQANEDLHKFFANMPSWYVI